MSRYPEIAIEKVKLLPIAKRRSKVQLKFLGQPLPANATFEDWWNSLPAILAADDLKAVATAIVRARQKGKPVIIMMGGHVIKVGLSPILIDLMQEGVITCLAMNGAGIIHDVELSLFGVTSEDVAANLANGTFGMAQETGDFINQALTKAVTPPFSTTKVAPYGEGGSGGITTARRDQVGLGEVLGRELIQAKAKHLKISLLGQAYKLNVPVTVHVAIGADIIHQHPSADGAAIGELTLRDFRILARQVAGVGNGGVVLNIGSAVILPEVFVKALTVARNLGYSCKNFTTANFDMIQHYRPRVNVVQRPTQSGGQGYQITGHHEFMIPLLAMGIKLGMRK